MLILFIIITSIIMILIIDYYLKIKETKKDLLGQAALLSIKSSFDKWQRRNSDWWDHPHFETKRCNEEYFINNRKITKIIGKRIFTIIDTQYNKEKQKLKRDYGQKMLDLTILEIQDKSKEK